MIGLVCGGWCAEADPDGECILWTIGWLSVVNLHQDRFWEVPKTFTQLENDVFFY